MNMHFILSARRVSVNNLRKVRPKPKY